MSTVNEDLWTNDGFYRRESQFSFRPNTSVCYTPRTTLANINWIEWVIRNVKLVWVGTWE